MNLDEDGRLSHDVTCAGCGHNVRGLPLDGVCGECATAVATSLTGTALLGADPRWLRAMAAGVGWLTVLLPWLWLPLAWPLVVWGAWLATTPRQNPAGGELRRILLRGGVFAAVGGVPLCLLGVIGRYPSSQTNDVLLFLLTTIAGLIMWYALLAAHLTRVLQLRGKSIAPWLALAAVVAGPLLVGWLSWVMELWSTAGDWPSGAGAIAILLLLITIACLPVLLVSLWRALDRVATRAADRAARPCVRLSAPAATRPGDAAPATRA
jgi:hypothetical protein